MEADDLLKAIGGRGRFQILVYISLCLVYMRGAWHAFAIMFLGICFFIRWTAFKENINSLANNEILEVTKLKASADDKLNFAKMAIFLFYRVENTLGKGENAGYHHFLFSHSIFQSLLL